jgi:hypothetical protein
MLRNLLLDEGPELDGSPPQLTKTLKTSIDETQAIQRRMILPPVFYDLAREPLSIRIDSRVLCMLADDSVPCSVRQVFLKFPHDSVGGA